MEQVVTFKKLIPDLALDKIDIAEENVRKKQVETGLEELKASIERLGLIHPVIVIPTEDGRYRLIVGQRRLKAFVALGRPTIPALVIEPVSSDRQRLVSFSENIHRRKLPYDDTIRVCDYLFSHYPGNKRAKVAKIAQDLNISPATVLKYLSYKLVPDAVQKLVTDGKLPAQVAYRITVAFWPNTQKIEEMARLTTRLTKAERDRAIDIGRRRPDAPLAGIVDEAKKVVPMVEISIYIEPQTMDLLDKAAKERDTDVKTLVKSVVEDWLSEEGSS